MKLIKNLGTRKNTHNKYSRRYGIFKCEYCNNIVEKDYHDGLRNKSCGCYKDILLKKSRTKHGDTVNGISRLYRIWCNMKARCYNPKEKDTKYYKDKNIKVCKQWKNNYIIFKIWALCHGYKDELTIDRIDSNGNYEPTNCSWITLKDNVNKNRYTKLSWSKIHIIRQIIHNNLCDINELSRIYNVSATLIRRIIQNKCWKEKINYGN